MPTTCLLQILSSAGPYIQTLDAHGWRELAGNGLLGALLGRDWEQGWQDTRLTTLNLQGCPMLSSRDIGRLIEASPDLRKISLKALQCVSSTHLDEIASRPEKLDTLDISHCKRLDPLCGSFLCMSHESAWDNLQELYLAGIAGEELMVDIARRLPNLQVLDVSYSKELTDEDFKEFVVPDKQAIEEVLSLYPFGMPKASEVVSGIKFILPCQAGQRAAAFPECRGWIPRRVTRLRKLVISNCPQLTDETCKYLAHAMPLVEVLEMANNHVDTGLVELLGSCPRIRKIDLEACNGVVDAVLETLTPYPTIPQERRVGSHLETLCIGFASNVSVVAMLELIKTCPRLKKLDLDVSTL